MELVDESDKNKDGKIDFQEFEDMGMSPTPFAVDSFAHASSVQRIKKKIPMAESHLVQVDKHSRPYGTKITSPH